MDSVSFLVNAILELQNEASEALHDTTSLELLERRENLIQALLLELKDVTNNTNSFLPYNVRYDIDNTKLFR